MADQSEEHDTSKLSSGADDATSSIKNSPSKSDVPTEPLPAVCSDPPLVSSAECEANSSPRPASEQLDVVPVSELVEQLKEAETIADETSSKQQIEVTIDRELIQEPLPVPGRGRRTRPSVTPILPVEPSSNVRVSARIKERTSTGRTRSFPYADDYVDLDVLEKQSRTSQTSKVKATPTAGRRASSSPEKRVSLRQQPIDASKSVPTKNRADVYDQMDTGNDVELTARKRPTSSSSSVAPASKKKSRATNEEEIDRPVKIALSSHLNFSAGQIETLGQLGFEVMDESCHVDALVVDRIRRTKKFFMCLARGAHILSPSWIETMIKENRYIPYEQFYLQDTSAETRYGFQIRESVRRAKEQRIFGKLQFFCTKDTSPPYDDLKEIIEAAGGKFLEKINIQRPAKDLICIVAQAHKNDYEDLFKKGVAILSEEFVLSGISKQKLDFDAFSLFPKTTNTK